jgi:hypothetical protein
MTGEPAPPPASLLTLLEGIVDYAGLFPPAELAMDQTAHNYAAYTKSAEAWMLGRLIIPAARLEEFEQAAEDLLPVDAAEEPWRISAILAPADAGVYEPQAEQLYLFNERHADPENGLAVIDIAETKPEDAEQIEAAVDALGEDIFLFAEVDVQGDPRGLIAAAAGADCGVKIRTGGVTPEAFPAAEPVARFLSAMARADAPFKATAGLHHPLTGQVDVPGSKSLGFLNVFLAAALARRDESIHEAALVRILELADPAAFSFEEDRASFADFTLSTDDIEDSRLAQAVSFGSCSFDEPCEDLNTLGWL